MEAKTNFLQFREKVTQKLPLSSKDPSSNWTERIKVTLGMLRRSVDVCIYRVPNELHKVNGDAYTPRIVSIGPLHADDHDLVAMSENKWICMLSLLQRAPDPENILDECSMVILDLEGEARGSYAENITFSNYELAEIILVDGCFILELFLRSWFVDFTEDDPIFRNAWMVPTLQNDLALLENQIPFFVLQHLFTIFKPHLPKAESCEIIELALSFFQAKPNQEATIKNGSHDVKHLLDLLHNFYQPPTFPLMGLEGKDNWGFRKCATQLLEAGVEFRMGREDHLLDIKFSNGVITIPPLYIKETTESLLRNLIAFEQCSSLNTTYHITSYAILMKSLIQSTSDVQLLLQRGILTNTSGVEDAFALFNNILKQVALKNFYYSDLCKCVNTYQKFAWHRYRRIAFWKVRSKRFLETWKNDEFFSPWRIISYVLLILTGLQTFYAVISYYPH